MSEKDEKYAIETIRLTTGYRSGKRVTEVAKDLDARIPKGKLISLLGVNGAGKSTLLRTIAGFIPPLGGEVMIEGRNLTEYSREELSRRIAVVLTGRPSLGHTTVRELVETGRAPYTGFRGRLSAGDQDIVKEVMKKTGIESMEDRGVGTLSDGEFQKVMIAKALAQDTPIILLDEPSAFLDFPSKVELMVLLRDLARNDGKCVILSSHDLNLALKLSDLLLLVDKNKGTAFGTPAEMAETGVLSEFISSPSIRLNGLTFEVVE